MRSTRNAWRHRTIGPNSKNSPKIRFKKFVKLTGYTSACLSLTNFEYALDDKGQWISKCLFSVVVWAKISTKKIDKFCPRLNQIKALSWNTEYYNSLMIIWAFWCIKDITECLYVMIWPLSNSWLVFWSKRWHQNDILKLTDLYERKRNLFWICWNLIVKTREINLIKHIFGRFSYLEQVYTGPS